jgi:GNAT superfamily N-acetyltransferase
VAHIGPVRIVVADPTSVQAARALTDYLQEIQGVAGITGVALSDALADAADYRPPSGVFLLALGDEGVVIGCAGLRGLSDGTGEVKRMWVATPARGHGVGGQLLAAVEEQARRLGYSRLLLDTNGALTAAMRLYAQNGYAAIERYNDNPDATHFFGKDLGRAQ